MSKYNPPTPTRAALQSHFFAVQDTSYGDFHSSLVPNLSRDRIIGVRMPQLRKIARALAAGKLTDISQPDINQADRSCFNAHQPCGPRLDGSKSDDLPSVKASPLRWQDYFAEVEDIYAHQKEQYLHDTSETSHAAPEAHPNASEDRRAPETCRATQGTRSDVPENRRTPETCRLAPLYYEEILTAGLALSYAKLPLAERFDWIRRFVPMIDNWAVCDTFCGTWKPKEAELPLLWDFLTANYLAVLHGSIEEDGRPAGAAEYDLRYGVVMLLNHFVQREDYVDRVLSICNEIDHPAYYVKMAVAWTLSYGFIFFPEKTIALFQSPDNRMDDFTYNKSIQKACESFRVPKETKNFLRSLRR